MFKCLKKHTIFFGFVCFEILFCNAWAEKAVLITAHGTAHGPHENSLFSGSCVPHHYNPWEQSVIEAVEQIKKNKSYPIEVAFGMWETQCIDEAIEKIKTQLSVRGKILDKLEVIPFFISDFSVVIKAQKYIFNLTDENPLPFELKKSAFLGKVSFHSAINYNSIISKILMKRAQSLIEIAKQKGYENTEKMELNIVMHGPIEQWENQRWLEMGHRFGADLAALGFSEIHVVSLQDDAKASIRNRNTEILRNEIIGAKNREHAAIVLPLLLAPEGIESGIIERLTGLNYVWSGEVLLPDPLIVDYLNFVLEYLL